MSPPRNISKLGETSAESHGERTPSTWISALILGCLLFQFGVPLTYYMGLRDDPYDERFAWRMFSSVRLYSCSTTSSEKIVSGGALIARPIDLERTVHMVWVSNLQRNRSRVIRSFLRARCSKPEVQSVKLVNTCRKTDGTLLPPQEYELECRQS